MKEFHQHLNRIWSEITAMSEDHRLVRVYRDRIEGIE